MDDFRMVDQSTETPLVSRGKVLFYSNAAEYWSQIPATVDGMLGGFGHISHIDIQGSSQFLRHLFKLRKPPGKLQALDCGAGIGRITKNLLFNFFDKVDLVEQNPLFVDQAKVALESHKKMGMFFCSGLQDFVPEPNFYDVIWCQWVLAHLTDGDLIRFLHACKKGLKRNGVIVLKENFTNSDLWEEDEIDSSITRPLHHMCLILEEAGLQCIKQKRQERLPTSLYPVYMIATSPVKANIDMRAINESELSNGSDEAFHTSHSICTKIESASSLFAGNGLTFKHVSEEVGLVTSVAHQSGDQENVVTDLQLLTGPCMGQLQESSTSSSAFCGLSDGKEILPCQPSLEQSTIVQENAMTDLQMPTISSVERMQKSLTSSLAHNDSPVETEVSEMQDCAVISLLSSTVPSERRVQEPSTSTSTVSSCMSSTESNNMVPHVHPIVLENELAGLQLPAAPLMGQTEGFLKSFSACCELSNKSNLSLPSKLVSGELFNSQSDTNHFLNSKGTTICMSSSE